MSVRTAISTDSSNQASASLPSSATPLSAFKLDKTIEMAIKDNIFPTNEAEAERALNKFKTNAERIRYFYELMKKNKMLPSKAVVKFEKFESLANEARERGDEASHYVTALQAYNEALCLAPPGSTAMGLAYASRSLVYANTGFYAFALENIESALENALSEEKKSELRKKMKNYKEKIAKKKKEEAKTEEIHLSYEKHPEISSIVDGLECESNRFIGRHIVTKRMLQPGDIILLEDPFITAPCKQYEYKGCYNCTEHNFFNLIPCPKSTSVMFCSTTCAEEAWERFYKYECPIVDGLYDWVANNFAVRVIFKLFTLIEDRNEIKKFLVQGLGTAFDCNFEHADELTKFRIFNSMCTNHEERSKMETLKIVYNCATVLHMLKEWTEFKNILEDSDLEHVFLELLMRFQEIESINNFDIVEPFKRSKTPIIHFSSNSMAHGNYLVASLFAHSCAPNATMFPANSRGKLGIVVLHPIQKGEPIFLNYGPTFATNEKDHRQIFLKNKYQFDCQCVACIDEKKFPFEESWTFGQPAEYEPPISKINPSTCLFDEEALECARQAREKISRFISSNFHKYPCAEIYAYQGFLQDAIHILAFKKPMDVVFPKKPSTESKTEMCCPVI